MFHLTGAGVLGNYVVVGMEWAEGTGEILGAEEGQMVGHWEDLSLPVKV